MGTIRFISRAGVVTLLLAGSSVFADDDKGYGMSEDKLRAAGERMRQTSQQMQKDIQERLESLRRERAALVARQSAERRQEAIRAQQQVEKDKAALAAVREAKQRDTLAVAQEKARIEVAARLAKVERARQSELKDKEEQEIALVRAQQKSLDAYKAGGKQQKLGTQTQFGVDL